MTDHQMFRPPAEAGSLLIRVADGCPHNACAFCAMYRGITYSQHGPEQIQTTIAQAGKAWPDARRIFLADGDVLALPMASLIAILDQLHRVFPALARVTCYASGRSLSAKTDDELNMLKTRKVHTVYIGLESGCDDVLRKMRKGVTVEAMIEGVQRAQHAGLCASVMVLVGLGGQEQSTRHVRKTVEVLNAMQPRLLSVLRVVPVARTPLARWIEDGSFCQLTEAGAIRELRDMLSELNLTHTVFRADHASNILPLSGRLPRDKARLIAELDELLGCEVLDAESPGIMPRLL